MLDAQDISVDCRCPGGGLQRHLFVLCLWNGGRPGAAGFTDPYHVISSLWLHTCNYIYPTHLICCNDDPVTPYKTLVTDLRICLSELRLWHYLPTLGICINKIQYLIVSIHYLIVSSLGLVIFQTTQCTKDPGPDGRYSGLGIRIFAASNHWTRRIGGRVITQSSILLEPAPNNQTSIGKLKEAGSKTEMSIETTIVGSL